MNIHKYLKAYPFIPAFCVFTAVVLLLGPLKEMPLDDDWIYMFSVRSLLLDHKLLIHDLATPTLVFHAAWGWLFSAIGGLSYSTLRISTLTLALIPIGLLGARKDLNSGLLMSPAFWLILNPVFLLLSFSFMTDVPYLSWAALSAWFYARGLEKDSGKYLFAGAIAASLAFLVRQVGIALPIAAAIVLLLGPKRKAALLLPAFLPVLAAVAGYYAWFDGSHGGNWAHDYYSGGFLPRFADYKHYAPEIIRRLFAAALYLSLFTAPYTLYMLAHVGLEPFRNRKTIVCLSAIFAFFLLNGGLPYFKGGGVITEWGIGRHYVGDLLSIILTPSGVTTGGFFPGFLTVISAMSLLVWCVKWKEFFRGAADDPFTRMLALSGTAQTLMILFCFEFFFDRYLLPALPAALLMAANAARLTQKRPLKLKTLSAYALLLGALGYWSVAGTWDYLNWNEAKWAAGRAAIKKGLPPESIDNGYEWAGTYSFGKNMAALKRLKGNLEIEPMEWRGGLKIKALSGFLPAKPNESTEVSSAAYFSPLALSYRAIYINEIPQKNKIAGRP